MLVGLSIRDVVLVDRLDLTLSPGLSVLTGETGAGKSILLDSLGLALGARADSGLVRRGAPQLAVTARFDPPATHPVWQVVADADVSAGPDDGEGLVLRRTVTADGRSRAHLNDQPVSVALLRRIGDTLVEVHGQFDTHGLLNPATHRGVLDAFAGTDGPDGAVGAVGGAHRLWRQRARQRAEAEATMARARADEDLLRHMTDELDQLDPRPDEEAALAERRATLMHGEKIAQAVGAAQSALRHGGGVDAALRTAQRHLERVAAKAEGRLDPVLAALDRAAIETSEAASTLAHASADLDLDPRHLEQAEERLFALRAAARKHGVPVDGLAALHTSLRERLAAIEDGGTAIVALAREEAAARTVYLEAARALSQRRSEAAARLDAGVMAELAPLKLDRAVFRTRVEAGAEETWSEAGLDTVAFEIATNPGAAPGPIHRIASGGELARFMLALKVVVARSSTVPTLVFDEVDTGIGGATADAVGERLARLAGDVQVLVVTHSPQVAARGHNHLKVEKIVVAEGASRGNRAAGEVRTQVVPLTAAARREEIARMLAGAEVTAEARAAAMRLIGAS